MKPWSHRLAPTPYPALILLALCSMTITTNGSDIRQPLDHRLQESFEAGDDIDKDVDDDVQEEQPPLVSRSLVPQLWLNYTAPAEPAAEAVSCAEAHAMCAYRAGCGLALQSYVLGCADLVDGKVDRCGDACRYSLIALMSTHEGQRLMKCNCSTDPACTKSRLRLSACHTADVLHAARADTVVSCSAAQWICAADPVCAAALGYYRDLCPAMFRGRACTDKCANSARILLRQSRKLATCTCDGTEDFECKAVRANMERLCFQKDNEIDDGKGREEEEGSKSSSSLRASLEKFLVLVSLFVSALARFINEAFTSSGLFGGEAVRAANAKIVDDGPSS